VDLRAAVACLRINKSLERVTDLAANIGERAVALAALPGGAIPFALEHMAELAAGMLGRALDALVNRDVAEARAVCQADQAVDDVNRAAILRVERLLSADPHDAGRLIQLLSVARHVERIADLATNIAEEVLYVVEGRLVRRSLTETAPTFVAPTSIAPAETRRTPTAV
ncbi:MAG: phosphate signaling complex PhoU family protein, partial [Planctomycetia bacterium]